jgi:hypothetical protein
MKGNTKLIQFLNSHQPTSLLRTCNNTIAITSKLTFKSGNLFDTKHHSKQEITLTAINNIVKKVFAASNSQTKTPMCQGCKSKQ